MADRLRPDGRLVSPILTGAPTSVASSASSVTLLPANNSRLGAVVYNESTAVLYLLMSGGAASNTRYSVQVAPGGYFEVPFEYAGQITGIWASANGSARITELS